MRSWFGALSAAVWLVLGQAGSAWAASATTLPQGAPEAAIDAWVAKTINAPGLMIGVRAETSVDLYDPNTLEKLPDGHLVGWFRSEVFTKDGPGWRSTLQKLELDCELLRLRVVSGAAYTANNLRGKATVVGAGAWSPPLTSETPAGEELLQACSFAPLIGTADWAKAMPPPPTDAEPGARKAWAQARLHLDGYLSLTEPGEGQLAFFAKTGLKTGPDGRLHARVRTELTEVSSLGPTGLRSSLHDMEIDCAHGRYVGTKLAVYPGSNLLGPAYDIFEEDAAWITPIAGSEMAIRVRALCRLAKTPEMPIAEARRQDPIPSPMSASSEDTERWVRANLNTAGYFVTGRNEQHASFINADVVNLPGGTIMAEVRLERFAPDPQIGSYRSLVQSAEIDCRAKRFRFLDATFYSESNLEGLLEASDEVEPWQKTLEGSTGAGVVAYACGAASLQGEDIDRARALPPEPVSFETDDITDWVSENIDLGEDAYVAHTDSWVTLYSPAQTERISQDTVRLWIRDEYFAPIVTDGVFMRSTHELLEIDCAQRRWRSLNMEVYPGSNNLGPGLKRKADPDPQWMFIEPGSVDSVLASTVCRSGADDLDASLSEPHLPGKRDKTPL